MRIGLGLPSALPGTRGREMLEWVRVAEERGFALVATNEHLTYPCYDPLVALAVAGGATQRVELLTDLLVVPIRDPVVLAKQAAGLDQLVGGRLTLGLGVGWRPSDFASTGSNLQGRGERFEEALEVMTRAWHGDELGHGRAVCPPLADGGIPVLIGGAPARAAPRAARWGTGWTAGLLAAGEVAAGREEVRRAWQEHGRSGEPRIVNCRYVALGSEALHGVDTYLADYYYEAPPEGIEAMVSGVLRTADELRDDLEAQQRAGVTDLVLFPVAGAPDEARRIADAVGGFLTGP